MKNAVSDLEEFQEHLDYRFNNLDLLNLALTHPSVGNDTGEPSDNNQRLEFLGDAVLQLILSEELFAKFKRVGEGILTKTRAELVNRNTLAEQARAFGLDKRIQLSRGEEQNNGRNRPSILADAYEAFIGAVFIDGGYIAAQRIVLNQFAERLETMESPTTMRNPKGELQELLQAASPEHPHYQLSNTDGPDHDRVFECTVAYRNQVIGSGTGKSKKAAESNAVAQALDRYRNGEITPK